MKFEFEFEEQENYSLEDVQAILSNVTGQVEEIIKGKDETITTLTGDSEKLKELEESNHSLAIKNLALKNGIGDDMIGLIEDNDLEVVKSKIELVKGLQKTKDVDNSYKPTDKRKDDDYEKATDNKDTEGMIKSKLNRMFG